MANPLKSIFANGMSLFKRDTVESVVGIDIGTSAIKVVQLRRKGGKAVLETYGTLALGPYAKGDVGQVTNLSAEDLAKAMTDTLRESNVTSSNCAIAIPASSSLIFTMELPGIIEEKTLEQVIPTEARKYIPVPISEVSLDWSVIPKATSDEEGTVEKNEILVAAIHNDTVARYRSLASSAKLNAAFFEIEVFSSIRSVLTHDLSTVMIVDIGASKTKITIMEYGTVKRFHIINRGSQDITNNLSKSLAIPFTRAEEIKRETGLSRNVQDQAIPDTIKLVMDYIFGEANSVLLDYERKYNKIVSKVILTGGGSLLKEIIADAKTTFRNDVVLGTPFDKVEAPAFLGDVLKDAGPEFSVAVGLALRELEG
jgi:type IV pilus assembly protein PilM